MDYQQLYQQLLPTPTVSTLEAQVASEQQNLDTISLTLLSTLPPEHVDRETQARLEDTINRLRDLEIAKTQELREKRRILEASRDIQERRKDPLIIPDNNTQRIREINIAEAQNFIGTLTEENVVSDVKEFFRRLFDYGTLSLFSHNDFLAVFIALLDTGLRSQIDLTEYPAFPDLARWFYSLYHRPVSYQQKENLIRDFARKAQEPIHTTMIRYERVAREIDSFYNQAEPFYMSNTNRINILGKALIAPASDLFERWKAQKLDNALPVTYDSALAEATQIEEMVKSYPKSEFKLEEKPILKHNSSMSSVHNIELTDEEHSNDPECNVAIRTNRNRQSRDPHTSPYLNRRQNQIKFNSNIDYSKLPGKKSPLYRSQSPSKSNTNDNDHRMDYRDSDDRREHVQRRDYKPYNPEHGERTHTARSERQFDRHYSSSRTDKYSGPQNHWEKPKNRRHSFDSYHTDRRFGRRHSNSRDSEDHRYPDRRYPRPRYNSEDRYDHQYPDRRQSRKRYDSEERANLDRQNSRDSYYSWNSNYNRKSDHNRNKNKKQDGYRSNKPSQDQEVGIYNCKRCGHCSADFKKWIYADHTTNMCRAYTHVSPTACIWCRENKNIIAHHWESECLGKPKNVEAHNIEAQGLHEQKSE